MRQKSSYDAGARFAHSSASRMAAARTPELPASVRRKERIGAANSRRQFVRPLGKAGKSAIFATLLPRARVEAA
ncbi:hypothetical protein GCM10009534_53670 [Kribbella sandramycini]